MRISVWVWVAVTALSGCSSNSNSRRSSSPSGSTYLMPYTDQNSRAPAAAWAADGMYIRKPMPDRRDWKPWEFYYKHCSINGNQSHYSKTSYDCSGPYY